MYYLKGGKKKKKSPQKTSLSCDRNGTFLFLFLVPKEWVFSDPLIRQQDKCLSITSFSTGSQITLEACNQKDGRQVIVTFVNPFIVTYQCSYSSASCRCKPSTTKVCQSPCCLCISLSGVLHKRGCMTLPVTKESADNTNVWVVTPHHFTPWIHAHSGRPMCGWSTASGWGR